jgi:multidrug transporter EmrE-like cation transporter
MKDKIQLFTTGFIQVILVAVNTYQIAHDKYSGVFVIGFLISFVWSFNVKKIAFGTMRDRIIYATGAACGSIMGLIVSNFIYD